MHYEMGRTSLIIIDEISMVSNLMLSFVHERLCDLSRKRSTPFGGYNIVVLGDLLQLPPVNAPYAFQIMTGPEIRKAFPGSRSSSLPVNVWQAFTYSELTQNMRQQEDQAYANILNRLRIGDTSHLQPLMDRLVAINRTPEDISRFIQGNDNVISGPKRIDFVIVFLGKHCYPRRITFCN